MPAASTFIGNRNLTRNLSEVRRRRLESARPRARSCLLRIRRTAQGTHKLPHSTPTMYTNLQLAIQKNETHRIDHLLQTERVDIHETNNCNENALFFACRRKMLDLARTLLERGADMHVVTLRGETAFSHAVHWGNMATIRLLVEFGLDLKREAVKPPLKKCLLFFAAIKDRAETLDLFLQAGVDSNTEDEDGITPLMLSVHNGHYESGRLLLDAGADPLRTNCVGSSAFSLAHEWDLVKRIRARMRWCILKRKVWPRVQCHAALRAWHDEVRHRPCHHDMTLVDDAMAAPIFSSGTLRSSRSVLDDLVHDWIQFLDSKVGRRCFSTYSFIAGGRPVIPPDEMRQLLSEAMVHMPATDKAFKDYFRLVLEAFLRHLYRRCKDASCRKACCAWRTSGVSRVDDVLQMCKLRDSLPGLALDAPERGSMDEQAWAEHTYAKTKRRTNAASER